MVVGIGSIEVKALVLTGSELVAMEICMIKYISIIIILKLLLLARTIMAVLTLSDVADIVVVLATEICRVR